MRIKTFAKINLSLDVVSKRADGYHNLSMIMQQINLYDNIYVDVSDNITVENNIGLPNDNGNIAYRVAKAFFAYTKIDGGAKIAIEKNIPLGAGLAGGSSNGAGVLIALNSLYNTNLTQKELISIGGKIGADIPFCIMGGCALAEGIGEVLTPLTPIKNVCILLVKPKVFVSTKEIFSRVNLEKIKKRPNNEALIYALKKGDSEFVAQNMVNVLEEITASIYEEINDYKKILLENNAMGAMMSGSGSTVFGIFKDKNVAEDALERFSNYEFAKIVQM